MLWFAVPGYSAPHSEEVVHPKPLILSIQLQCESWPEIQESLSSHTRGIYSLIFTFQGFLFICLQSIFFFFLQ